MRKLPPALMVVLAISFSGCFGGDNDTTTDETDGSTPTSPGDGNDTFARVTLLNHTESAAVGEEINVTWRVVSGSNTTVNISHTAVHWADYNVSDPQTPQDYGNTSGEQVATVPGEFNATFTVDNPVESIFLRAHALIEGQNYWSKEVEITLEGGGANGAVHTVNISGVGALSEYDPDPLTINVGEGVKWMNDDTAGQTHTATSDEDAPEAFDTGNIPSGQESEPTYFTEPGTYEYHCSFHPTTMRAELIVVGS